jgi:hypothetical protein
VDGQHQQRVGHLLGPLPPEMRNDTAFMDRIHCYLPGWDIPKVSKELFTDLALSATFWRSASLGSEPRIVSIFLLVSTAE